MSSNGIHYNEARELTLERLLVEHGADMNARTVDGYTPRYLARLNKKRMAAEFLRCAGAI